MNDSQKAMCLNSADENKRRYKSIENKAGKAVSKAMRERRRKRHLLNYKSIHMACLG